MTKIPAFQFYPADWRKDLAVQSLTFHERGIWFEILCLMHEAESRGRLVVNGIPMSDDTIARMIGAHKQDFEKALSRLLELKVADRGSKGELINRRMVRDENLRRVRAESGKKGGEATMSKLLQTDVDIGFAQANRQANLKQTSEDEDEDVNKKKNQERAREAEPSVLTDLLDQLRNFFGVVMLADEFEWMATADFAATNGWTPKDVMDCLRHLKAEKWRTGNVRPRTVREALPDFMLKKKQTSVPKFDVDLSQLYTQ